MIRRALTPILAALALTFMLAACNEEGPAAGPTPESTAIEFMTAYVEGDEATVCELADREVGDCTTRPANEFSEAPTAGEVFENEETGSTAVLVEYTTTSRPDEPYTYAVEVKEDGKVTSWEDMSGQPKTRESVVMVLEWSE